MSFLREMFSDVSAEDPKRFLVEAMLGAMGADGEVSEEEIVLLDRTLEENELFRDVSKEARGRLIDSAADRIREAGGGHERLPAIGKGLAGRTQKHLAYALACEMCVADGQLPDSEIRYLEGLQEHLQLDDENAKDIFEGVRQTSGLQTVQERAEAMRGLIPHFVDAMALMAAADGEIHDEELVGVRVVLESIPDMAVLSANELNDAIVESFGRIGETEPEEAIVAISNNISQSSDRFWTVVYMMIICLADGKTDWREVAFLTMTRDAFELSDPLMDKAMQMATDFPNAGELG